MPSQLTNPRGSFDQLAVAGPTGQTVQQYVAGAAIPANTIVAVEYNTTTQALQVVAAIAASKTIIGVVERAVAADEIALVVTEGPAKVRNNATGTAMTLPNHVAAGAAGGVVAFAATAGNRIVGFGLEAILSGDATGALKQIYVSPGIVPT
jgi:hypothetical protein